MDTTTIVTLVRETCCECGIMFAMTEEFKKQRKSDGETFYCPNGHGQHYTDTNKKRMAALRRRAESAERRAAHLQEQSDHYSYQARAYKGHKTRLKNAITKGKCPCCGEHFQNLESHMKNQHPEFSVDE